ncbi:GNAT family N-acetyltransferase [Pontibacter sp. Tf4]|uniref:GNAT family N-acetyltransferase n=1 Tax=Pontibacter sp. Tf4 TaxID=2761620 RepID=UPI00162417BD|nr:GNAT family N-acetyltransferase [Pontibacter sp. Tf4]MBB6611237.1 GNAT family N-acetyltransferase [Pontibacter sp. Tf4]
MEPEYSFTLLAAQDMPVLHQIFLNAFADYIVPIQLTEEQFYTKLKREGIEPAFCVGAYSGGKMVGFILTGLGEYQGKPTAYNAGTGVLPAHRGHHLTRKMYEVLLPKLRESGLERGLLEVIQENEPALRSYKAIGFQVTRSLDCFRARKEELLLSGTPPDDITITEVTKPDWATYRHLWDVEPAWQHTASAISRSPDQKIILEARDEQEELTGYLVLFPKTGAIAQLAVAKDKREQGIGKELLRNAVALTSAPALLLINVDAGAVSFKSFLKRRYFNRFLGQFEMELDLMR